MKIERYINKKNIDKVRELDQWCMRCGRKDSLEVHHIISRGVCHIDHMWNVIGLCFSCHRLIHDKLGYKGMTKILRYYQDGDHFRWGTALAYIEERI